MSEEESTPRWLGDSEMLAGAYRLASAAHRGQPGKDGRSPYIRHPMAVAERLATEGFDERTLAAAILHDAVEDSDLRLDEVVAEFGVEIGEMVSALTDDARIEDLLERKREHRERVAEADSRALAIYAADKLVNVGDLRELYERMGEAAGSRLDMSIDDRIALWREDLTMLERRGDTGPLTSELREELSAFEAERPGARAAGLA